MLILIVVLVVVVIAFVWYIFSLNRTLDVYYDVNKGVSTLNVLQNFLAVMGQDINSVKKINKLNEILIHGYNIDYSSIVVFDGTRYIVKTSNVQEFYWENMSSLHMVPDFQESINTTNVKYLKTQSVNNPLDYPGAAERGIKSAMFFPLYIDNVYIGYWIIESDKPNAFDEIEMESVEIIRNNIIGVLQSISYQNSIESMVIQDKFSGLKSKSYLFGEGKNTLNNYVMSTMALFEITNLVEINEKYGRKSGDKIVTEVSERTKNIIPENAIFIRYMGPKFAVRIPRNAS